jgi:hypothetical protein
MSSQVARLIRAGMDPEIVAGAVAQLEGELAALDRRASDITRWIAEGEAARGVSRAWAPSRSGRPAAWAR